MAIHIRNPETEALARRVASLKGIGLAEAVHLALQQELAREQAGPSLADVSVDFAKRLRARGNSAAGQAADKDFVDELYQRDGD
jgi:antitoxin VapB